MRESESSGLVQGSRRPPRLLSGSSGLTCLAARDQHVQRVVDVALGFDTAANLELDRDFAVVEARRIDAQGQPERLATAEPFELDAIASETSGAPLEGHPRKRRPRRRRLRLAADLLRWRPRAADHKHAGPVIFHSHTAIQLRKVPLLLFAWLTDSLQKPSRAASTSPPFRRRV